MRIVLFPLYFLPQTQQRNAHTLQDNARLQAEHIRFAHIEENFI